MTWIIKTESGAYEAEHVETEVDTDETVYGDGTVMHTHTRAALVLDQVVIRHSDGEVSVVPHVRLHRPEGATITWKDRP